MAGEFGGGVKLTGEKDYRAALTAITRNLKEVSSEMNRVTSSFDANDDSAATLEQQQKELSAIYDKQQSELSKLSSTYDSMDQTLEASKKNTQDLTKELNDEKAKLSDIEKASGKTSKEYQEQAKKVKDLENSVKASENENQRMAKAMQDVRIKMNETETACNRTKQQIDNLGKATKEAGENAQEANGGWSIFKGVVANLATSAIQSAINGLKQLGQAALDIGKQALSSYSDYEQLKGGVETLFGDDTAKIVERNAQNAFKTAGLSANQYMETVTSFSASLLKSVGGDTEKAAKIADKAITDMADNANKMGTSIDSIQNAYAGFAKGNYTMLDNLKLGYGGTRQEMQRLIKDANAINKANGKNTKLSIKNYADIVEAIHVVQEEMGIEGATAAEAETTIQGSLAATKSAWENLLSGLANGDADIGQLVSNLVKSVATAARNILPAIVQIAKSLGEALPALFAEIGPLLAEFGPQLLEAGGKILGAIWDGIKALWPSIVEWFSGLGSNIVTWLSEKWADIKQAGSDLVSQISSGISEKWTAVTTWFSNLGTNIALWFIGAWGTVKKAGTDLASKISSGISDKWTSVTDFFSNLGTNIVTWFSNAWTDLTTAGSDIVGQISGGISENWTKVTDYFTNFGTNIGTWFSTAWTNVKTVGSDIVNNIKKGISGEWEGFETMMTGVMPRVANWLSQAWDSIQEKGSTILKKIQDGVTDTEAWTNFRKFMEAIIPGVARWFDNAMTDIKEKGSAVLTNIKNGIIEAWTNFKNWISVKVGVFAKWFDIGAKLKSMGEGFLGQLWEGIKSKINWLGNQISGLANQVLPGWLKQLLGVGDNSDGSKGGNVGDRFDIPDPTSKAVSRAFADVQTPSRAIPQAAQMTYDDAVRAFKEALYQVKIEMDDTEMAHFVDRTVTRLVYT